MDKQNRTILIVVLILLIIFFYRSPISFNVIQDQLKQEFTTYWADQTDEVIASSNCIGVSTQSEFDAKVLQYQTIGYGCVSLITLPQKIYQETYKFVNDGTTSLNTDAETLKLSASNGNPMSMRTKQTFIGQEVALIFNGGGAWDTSGQTGSCNIQPAGQPKCTSTSCGNTLIKYIPHTFDTKYDVIQDGVKTGEFDAPTGFKVGAYCSVNGGKATLTGFIDYIGNKAQFECDLASFEVFVRERFIQRFSIKDLSYIPTKFCQSTRPFVLRNLDFGETAISRSEGIEPLNRGEVIPSRDLTNREIIEVSYATYLVPELGEPCAFDEVKEKVDGIWVCKKFTEPLQLNTQPIPTQKSIWDLIAEIFIGLFNFIKSLFGV